MSMETQMQIKENSTELNEFLQDLTAWEHTVKDKEKKLVGSAKKTTPAVRGHKEVSLEKKGVLSNDSEKNVPKKEPAGHTYDYFKDKWDKFDVDAALAEVDEEPQKPSPKKVARTSKSKPPDAKVKAVAKPSKPTLSVPTSNSHGAPRSSSSGSLAGLGSLTSSYGLEEGPTPDAMSEKDLGNEFFKEGKYVNAIECYSRSIAFQPTAVAFANRAMALLKIRRYADAEVDCTEAISLDDRYTKVYSRRGTARKELQKYFAAVEDFEFALRLEPENKELKKQYIEAQDIYEKFASKTKPLQKRTPVFVEELSSPKISPRTVNSLERGGLSSARQQTTDSSSKTTDNSGASSARNLDERKPESPIRSTKTVAASSSLSSPDNTSLKAGNVPFDRNDTGISASGRTVASTRPRATPTETATSQLASTAQPRNSDENLCAPGRLSRPVEAPASTQEVRIAASAQPETSDDILAWSRKLDASRPPSAQPTNIEELPKKGKMVDGKLTAQVIAPSQAAVDRAAMNVTAGLARNMIAPKTSYEFEATWKGFASDRRSQSRLLKIMEPTSLPKVFKDLLGAPLLMDIMNCLPLLLPDDTRLALRILENLVKVGRFDMTILFLTTKDKTVMRKLWEDILATEELSIHEETKLNALRSKYKL